MARFHFRSPRRSSRHGMKSIEALERRRLLTAVSWIGAASGDFDVAQNWSTGVVPGPTDDVTINVAGITVTHSAGVDTVNSLTTDEPFDLTGGTLTVANALTLNNTFTVSGGTLQQANVVNARNLAFSGNSGVLSGITVDSNLTLAADNTSIDIENGITLGGTLALVVAGNNCQVTFGGTQTLASGTILFDGIGDALFVDPGGTLTLGTAAGVSGSSSGVLGAAALNSTLINQGTIHLQGTGALDIAASMFMNLGTIYADLGGAVKISAASWSNTGSISAGPGGTIGLGGTTTTANLGNVTAAGGAVNVQGVIDNTGATLNFVATTGSWNLTNGGVIRGGALAFNSQSLNLTASGGTLDGVTLNNDLFVTSPAATATIQNGINLGGNTIHLVASGSTLTFFGNQTLNSGTISLEAGNNAILQDGVVPSTLTIAPAAHIQGGGGTIGSPPYNIVNQGEISINTPGQILTLGASIFDNQGNVRAYLGTFLINGDYNADPAGNIDIAVSAAGAGQFAVIGGFGLAGNLNIQAGVPPQGTSFDVVTYGSSTGMFSTINGLVAPSVVLTPTVGPTAITLFTTVGAPSATLKIDGPFYTPGTYQTGDTIIFRAREHNDGTQATGPFMLKLVLSADQVIGNSDDLVVFTSSEASLNPGESRPLSHTYTIPAGTPDGKYFTLGEQVGGQGLDAAQMPQIPYVSPTADIVITTPPPVPPPSKVGGLDPSFGNQGVAVHNVGFTRTSDVALQTNGKSIIAGVYGAPGSEDFGLTRYNANGSLDVTFGVAGVITTDFGGDDEPASVSLIADGKILVAGTSTTLVNGQPTGSRFAVARYNSDGTLDTTFGGGTGEVLTSFSSNAGALTNDTAHALVVRPDGTFVVGGSSDAAGRGLDFALAMYKVDGTPVTAFGRSGTSLTDFRGSDDSINGLGLEPDGGLIAVGWATAPATGTRRVAVSRFLPTGLLDKRFGTNGRVMTNVRGVDDEAASVAFEPNGPIIVGGLSASGSVAAGNLSSDFLLIGYTRDGRVNREFGDGPIITSFGQTSAITRVLVQADGGVVASGRTTSQLGSATPDKFDLALARYTRTGKPDKTFAGTGQAVFDIASATAGAARTHRVLTPRKVKARVGAGSGGDLHAKFKDFEQSTQGALASNQGGALLDVGNSGMDTAEASIVASGVDLSASVSTTLPASVIAGTKAIATVQITESGTSTASGSVTINLAASTNNQATGALPVQSFSERLNLKPNQRAVYKLPFVVPQSIPDATYYMLATVSPVGMNDLNLANNTAANPSTVQTVQPFADLAGGGVTTPPALARGKSATVSVSMSNRGNIAIKGSVPLQFLASPDWTLASAFAISGPGTVKVNLAPGATGSYAAKIAVPTTLPAGSYFLLVQLDPGNALGDPNLANNLVTSSSRLIVG